MHIHPYTQTHLCRIPTRSLTNHIICRDATRVGRGPIPPDVATMQEVGATGVLEMAVLFVTLGSAVWSHWQLTSQQIRGRADCENFAILWGVGARNIYDPRLHGRRLWGWARPPVVGGLLFSLTFSRVQTPTLFDSPQDNLAQTLSRTTHNHYHCLPNPSVRRFFCTLSFRSHSVRLCLSLSSCLSRLLIPSLPPSLSHTLPLSRLPVSSSFQGDVQGLVALCKRHGATGCGLCSCMQCK